MSCCWRPVAAAAALGCLCLAVTGCGSRTVGGDDARVVTDAASLDGAARCAPWDASSIWAWNPDNDRPAWYVDVAVGHGGTMLGAWQGDGVWGRARCSSGAPLLQGGLVTRIDSGDATALNQPWVEALAGGGYVVAWWVGLRYEIGAAWLDEQGVPTGVVHTVSTADSTGRKPAVLPLTDGTVAIAWEHWVRRYNANGAPLHEEPFYVDGTVLGGVATTDGRLLLLLEGGPCTNPPDCTVAEPPSGIGRYSFDPGGALVEEERIAYAPDFCFVGAGGCAIAAAPGVGRAAMARLDSYWISVVPLDELGRADGAPTHFDHYGEQVIWTGWVDVALDGQGEIGVVWNSSGGTIRAWTESGGTSVLAFGGDGMLRFPTIAGHPDGGFVTLWSSYTQGEGTEQIHARLVGRE